MNVPAGARIPLSLKNANGATKTRLAAHRDLIMTLARLSSLDADDAAVPAGALQDVLDEATLVMPVAGVIDMRAERDRLAKEIAKLDSEIGKFDKKLANAQFLSKAPPEVVEEQKARRADAAQAKTKLEQAMGRLAEV
jgi:valyl-tRNA synthetase